MFCLGFARQNPHGIYLYPSKMSSQWTLSKIKQLQLKAHNLPIAVSKTNTRNFCIVTICKVMPIYEITISKSFAN